MDAKCPCLHCDSHIEFEVSRAGEIVACPHCGIETTLFVPRVKSPPPLLESKRPSEEASSQNSIKKPILVKIYKGSQEKAMLAFQEDSAKKAVTGYYPISQMWVPGAYSTGTFLGALLLCIFCIGIIIFIYMIIVKPPGSLSVTYELRQS